MKKFIVLAIAAVLAMPSAMMAQKTTVQTVTRQKTYNTFLRNISVWYQGEVNVGYAISGNIVDKLDGEKLNTNFSRPFVETTHGIRITKYAFLGAGLGLQFAPGKIEPDFEDYYDDYYGYEVKSPRWNTLLMPLFINVKGYYPVTDDIAPYISLSFGGAPVLTSNISAIDEDFRLGGRAYCKFGAGVNYKKWTFDFGVMHQGLFINDWDEPKEYGSKYRINSFYMNVGFVF